jgi:hypothetical protein
MTRKKKLPVIPTDKPPDDLSPNRDSKPIDKFTNIKMQFDTILKNKNSKDIIDYDPLKDAFIRANDLIFKAYPFMRLYILDCIEKKIDLPLINESFVVLVFRALSCTPKGGGKPQGKNLTIYNNLLTFYNTTFNVLIRDPENMNKCDSSNLSSILSQSAKEIVTSINNNIWMHFTNRVNQFVNQMFKKETTLILKDLKGDAKDEKRAAIKRELCVLKDCLLKKELLPDTLDVKYRIWTKKYRNLILPDVYQSTATSYQDDVKNKPQKYFKYMINMIHILEKESTEECPLKLFQFFPIRTSMIHQYIHIDTKALIEIFDKGNKKNNLKNISKMKDILWRKYFDLSNKMFNISNEVTESNSKSKQFDYSISTDMYAVSVRFIHNSFIKQHNKRKSNRKIAKAAATKVYKNMNQKDKEKLKDNKEENKTKKKEESKQKSAAKYKADRAIFNNLPKEEQDRIKKLKKSKIPYTEFPYITDLTEPELAHLKSDKVEVIYIDPGKRSIFYMMNKEGKTFNYTTKCRLHHTKRIQYNKNILTFKNKNPLFEYERCLSVFNTKTCDINKFKQYVMFKTLVYKQLINLYSDPLFRKLKWFTYINTKRENNRFLNSVATFYNKERPIIDNKNNIVKLEIPKPDKKGKIKKGIVERRKRSALKKAGINPVPNPIPKKTIKKELIFIVGDWGANYGMKGCISTPGIGMKKILASNRPDIDNFKTAYKVYSLVEFRTSCLDYRTEVKMKNLYLPKPVKRNKYKGVAEDKKKKLEEIDRKLREAEKECSNKRTNNNNKRAVKRTAKPELVKMHSILLSQISNKETGCINRDRNSVYNMRKIVNHYLETGERLINFSRTTKYNELVVLTPEQIKQNALTVKDHRSNRVIR